MKHRRWRVLLVTDLLAAAALVLLAWTAYVPVFFFNVAWFLPLALLPRGVLTELLVRRPPAKRNSGRSGRHFSHRTQPDY